MKQYALAIILLSPALPGAADEYEIDNSHSYIEFAVSHIGVSIMKGGFNSIRGAFTDGAAAAIEIEIDTDSLNTHHARRDRHLKDADFFDVKRYPKASFRSTRFDPDSGELRGTLTFLGQAREAVFQVAQVGAGVHPRDGSYRVGYRAEGELDRRDFGMDYDLGPASWKVQLTVFLEGVRKEPGAGDRR